MSVYEWIEQMDLLFDAKHASEPDRCLWARTVICGNARSALSFLPVTDDLPLTWTRIKDFLRTKFTPLGLQTRIRDQLLALHMRGNDSDRYLHDFYTLISKCVGMSEEDKIFFLRHGLPSDAQREILYHQPRTLEEAISRFLGYTQSVSSTSSMSLVQNAPMELDHVSFQSRRFFTQT